MGPPIITLTTDFGISSPYVAQMKGVILGINPDLQIVDVTHAIGPQNILEGAIILGDVAHTFPPGTLHVAVVDPGVGTDRRIVYVQVGGGQTFLVPDNGLLTHVLKRHPPERLLHMNRRETWNNSVSHTFHGRDIFAPLAARLSLGTPPEQLGAPIEDIVRVKIPEPEFDDNRLRGQVLVVDSFGNLITNILEMQVVALGPSEDLLVLCDRHSIEGVNRIYADKPHGETIALIDSQGRLEIAVAGGNAAKMLGAGQGAAVVVHRR